MSASSILLALPRLRASGPPEPSKDYVSWFFCRGAKQRDRNTCDPHVLLYSQRRLFVLHLIPRWPDKKLFDWSVPALREERQSSFPFGFCPIHFPHVTSHVFSSPQYHAQSSSVIPNPTPRSNFHRARPYLAGICAFALVLPIARLPFNIHT